MPGLTGTALRISRVHYPVTALGPGRRLGIWVQGCPLACQGCMARDTWEPAAGQEVTVGRLLDAWSAAVSDGADGLTVSGGEPLEQAPAVAALLAGAGVIRADQPREIDVLLYTGYEPAEVDGLGDAARCAVEWADAVVFGRFDVTRPTRLVWRGSANQILTPRTALGRSRYQPYLGYEPERAPVQVAVDEQDIWFVGVPRRGDLHRLERAMTRLGVRWENQSWRP